MIQQFTRAEQQHILVMMNAFSDPACQDCSDIRKKLEENIASMPAMQPAPVFFMEDSDANTGSGTERTG